MKLNLTYLEELNEIISSNDCFLKKKKKVAKTKKTEGYTYQFYNQLCACILRIRETSRYLDNDFKFRKENNSGQAFDFYEFINCTAIIKGSVEVLFKIFGLDYKKHYPSNKAFSISNKTKNSDISFFNFIRSAASMHPTETTSHNKITKHKFEVYPYAIWINRTISLLKGDVPSEADMELVGWDCKTKGNYKYYYLVTSEFSIFINNLLLSIKNLIPVVNKIAADYKELIRCKRLKSVGEFASKKDYCLYLRKRIHSKLTDDEFPDGGLLLASHALMNELLGADFKRYIEKRIKTIVNKMITDITTIDYDEIFDNLYLGNILKCNESHYIAEKFHDYLYRETIYEIEKESFVEFKNCIRYEENNCNYTNAEWAVIKLISCKNSNIDEAIKKAKTYCDLYELVLELIYKEQNI